MTNLYREYTASQAMFNGEKDNIMLEFLVIAFIFTFYLFVNFFSVLVDKDQSPKWDPPTLEGVTKEHVDWYFSRLPEERELKL